MYLLPNRFPMLINLYYPHFYTGAVDFEFVEMWISPWIVEILNFYCDSSCFFNKFDLEVGGSGNYITGKPLDGIFGQ